MAGFQYIELFLSLQIHLFVIRLFAIGTHYFELLPSLGDWESIFVAGDT